MGNACELVIEGKNVIIYDVLAQTEEEYCGTCFKTTITDLKRTVDEWCEKLKEFKNTD